MAMRYNSVCPPVRRGSRLLWTIGGICLVCTVLAAVFLIGIYTQRKQADTSGAALRWQASDSTVTYAQLSVHYASASAIDLETVQMKRMNIQRILEENAIDIPKGAAAFIDAFSGETKLTLSGNHGSVTTNATVCGGNFFFFHPVELLDGTYFHEDDLTVRSVVIDEYAAWKLFGAIEVSGMDVIIDGQRFRISGVCRKPEDPIWAQVWGDIPRIFVHYSGLRLTNGFDSMSSYEIVMPNPVDGFASKVIAEQFSVTASSADVVLYDETERFSFETLVKQIPTFFNRVIRTDTVLPPYWENAVRVSEIKAIVLAFFCSVFGSLGLLSAAVFMIIGFRLHPVRLRNIRLYVQKKYEMHHMKRWLKKHKQ